MIMTSCSLYTDIPQHRYIPYQATKLLQTQNVSAVKKAHRRGSILFPAIFLLRFAQVVKQSLVAATLPKGDVQSSHLYMCLLRAALFLLTLKQEAYFLAQCVVSGCTQTSCYAAKV